MIETLENRRDFIIKSLTAAGITLCAGTLTSLVTACENTAKVASITGPYDINVKDYHELDNIGGVKVLNIPNHNAGLNVFIIRVDDNTFLVLSSKCGHEGTQVNLIGGGRFLCPNHGALYFSNGKVNIGANGGKDKTNDLQSFSNTYDQLSGKLTINF